MSFQTETASFNVTLAASSNLPNNNKDTGGGSSFFRLRHLHGIGRLQMRLRFSPYFNRFLPVLLHAPLARQECVVYNIYAVRLVGGRSVRWRNSLQGFAASVIFPVRHTPCRYLAGQHRMWWCPVPFCTVPAFPLCRHRLTRKSCLSSAYRH